MCYLHFINKGIEAKVIEVAGTGTQFLSLLFLPQLDSPRSYSPRLGKHQVDICM